MLTLFCGETGLRYRHQFLKGRTSLLLVCGCLLWLFAPLPPSLSQSAQATIQERGVEQSLHGIELQEPTTKVKTNDREAGGVRSSVGNLEGRNDQTSPSEPVAISSGPPEDESTGILKLLEEKIADQRTELLEEKIQSFDDRLDTTITIVLVAIAVFGLIPLSFAIYGGFSGRSQGARSSLLEH